MLTTTTSMAATLIDGIYYNLDSSARTAEVTSGSSEYTNSVTIPSSVTYSGVQYSVTSIGEKAFYNCRNLTSVSIPPTIISIGTGAFNKSKMIDLKITDLAAWCRISFADYLSNPLKCTSYFYLNNERIVNLVIPNGVTTIGDYAFYGYSGSGLTSVTIPNSVTSIGKFAFSFCSNLNKVTIDSESIMSENHAHVTSEDSSIKRIFWESPVNTFIIGNSVTSIGNYAFYDCTGLTSITIGNGVTNIGNYAFDGCTGLTSITIPSSVTSIGSNPFSNCSGLTSISVASGNTKYDSHNNCKAIIEKSTNTLISGCKNSVIPNGVTNIGDFAFYGCTGLTSVTIPSSMTSIGSSAFKGCKGLTSIDIPNGVTNIGKYAFDGCTGLTSVNIPPSVTQINFQAFNGCSNLTSVNITDLEAWCNIVFGYEISTTGDYYSSNPLHYAHYLYLNGEEITNLEIPDGVTRMRYLAFHGCSATSITIPSSVTYIEKYAFSPKSTTASVTVLNPTPISIHQDAFRYRSQSTLYVPYGSRSAYEAASYWKEFKQILEVDNRQEQTLSYSEIPTKTYGDAAFTLPSTTTEGFTITWTSSNTNVATINGNTVSIKGSGTATITATQEGNNSYKPFTKEFTLTVSKAALTITAKNFTIKQGDAMPTFEATYSGFKNNETASVLTTQPTFSCSATSASAPGTYDITVSGATASNYNITFAKGTLTITQADPVTVTANSYTIQYGDAIPTLGYTSNGAILNGTPALSCSATASSPAGTYPITITTGSVSNYNVTYVAGTLTITKAPLTISAKSYTIMQGEAMPTFEATYSGFKNNDDENILTTAPTFSCSATSVSAPGTYEIVVSGAASDRYDITNVNGTLTIDAAIATITIPAEGMTTYCPEYDLDFSGETDFKAYIIGGYNKKTSKVVAVEVSEVPAGMGLYLKGKPGTYEVPAAETESYFLNMLKGVTTATTIPATNGDFTNLTLSAATKPTFVAASDGSSVAANTAYLQIETAKYNGQPAEILLVGSGLVGDINKDGDVSISDVTTLVNMILGKE